VNNLPHGVLRKSLGYIMLKVALTALPVLQEQKLFRAKLSLWENRFWKKWKNA
jgi:hypothetical protein